MQAKFLRMIYFRKLADLGLLVFSFQTNNCRSSLFSRPQCSYSDFTFPDFTVVIEANNKDENKRQNIRHIFNLYIKTPTTKQTPFWCNRRQSRSNSPSIFHRHPEIHVGLHAFCTVYRV